MLPLPTVEVVQFVLEPESLNILLLSLLIPLLIDDHILVVCLAECGCFDHNVGHIFKDLQS